MQVWAFWVGPIVGAVLGALVYQLIGGRAEMRLPPGVIEPSVPAVSGGVAGGAVSVAQVSPSKNGKGE